MSPARGPVVPRRRLGAELRALREQAGLTIEEVAKALECSVSKVSRLETGRGIPYRRDVRDLLDRYGITDQARRDRLMRWVREGNRQGWWDNYSDVLASDSGDPLLRSADKLARYVALEQDASEVRSFETIVLHGLLQTADYARAILNTLGTVDPAVIEHLVEFRLRRQRRLYADEDPLIVNMVLDEAVLYRPVGGAQVMRGQLSRLLTDSQRPNVTLRVLPYSIGAHRAVSGSFVVLAFAGSDDHDLVYIEGHVGDLYIEKEEDVEVYRGIFDDLVSQCLTIDQSAKLVAEVLREV
jgi:transcriptional regulator with XRE-family HTH domain